jgi:hypothetical protein
MSVGVCPDYSGFDETPAGFYCQELATALEESEEISQLMDDLDLDPIEFVADATLGEEVTHHPVAKLAKLLQAFRAGVAKGSGDHENRAGVLADLDEMLAALEPVKEKAGKVGLFTV